MTEEVQRAFNALFDCSTFQNGSAYLMALLDDVLARLNNGKYDGE